MENPRYCLGCGEATGQITIDVPSNNSSFLSSGTATQEIDICRNRKCPRYALMSYFAFNQKPRKQDLLNPPSVKRSVTQTKSSNIKDKIDG